MVLASTTTIHVGIGHGMPVWMRQVGAWPASPLTLLDETLTATRALLAGERVTVSGRYVRLDNVALDSPPSIPPLVVAGVRGPKSLAVAGRSADGTVLAEPVTPEYLAASLAHIGASRRGQHRVIAYNVGVVDDDPSLARAVARVALEWIGEPDWAPHIAPLPFADDFARLRAESSSRQGFSEAMPDEWVDQLAVVGTVAAAKARLDSLIAAGANCNVLIPAGPDPMAALESLARLI